MKKFVMMAVVGLVAAAANVQAADGEAVYNKSCHTCHAMGVAGAPKLGDKEAWAPRIAQGMDTLYEVAIKGGVATGKNAAMPPKGTCMACSDEELKAAVDFMVSKAQ